MALFKCFCLDALAKDVQGSQVQSGLVSLDFYENEAKLKYLIGPLFERFEELQDSQFRSEAVQEIIDSQAFCKEIQCRECKASIGFRVLTASQASSLIFKDFLCIDKVIYDLK